MNPPSQQSRTRTGSRPELDCDKNKEEKPNCHLDSDVQSLKERVGELEMCIGSLTAEVSDSLKAIGSAPDKAKRLDGSGIAKSVVEIQESVDEIKTKLEDDDKEKTQTNLQKLTHTDLFLKKVQTVGTIITTVSGVIGIIGAIATGLFWLIKSMPH